MIKAGYKFNDIDIVRQDLKLQMPLDEFISLADARYTRETGIKCNPIEMVNDHLYKKCCDMDEHPVDQNDGTRDSTASFTICPQKEMYYCFGCGAHGDRFEYISSRFHVDHMESIIITAEIENVDLTPYLVELSTEERAKLELFKQNMDAMYIAHNELLKDGDALSYLHGRGITDESIELFNLGYAPGLIYGKTIFNDLPHCKTLQLHRKDQFNDAILFPITDANGRMRYFQSRPFNPISGMKYIGGNDDHPLFDNTDRIFGFNVAKRNLARNGGRLVGVEGAPDTIACVQQGITACGFLGTAINQNTFDLLDKYRVTELTLLLDGDKAGRDKTFKNSEKYLTLKTNVKLKVATLPDPYDPEEFINTFGPDKLREILDDAVYAVQYLIDTKWNDAKTPTQKAEFIYSIQDYMNAINDDIMKQLMITHIAGKVGMDPVQIEDYYMQSAVKNSAGSKLYSPDGEEILLGEAMRNPDFIPELVMRFKDNDWYLLKHRHLFKILRSSEYTDIESLYTIARNMNVDNIISHEWLEKLHNNYGNVEFSLKDVEDKLIRRKALEILDKTKIKLSDMESDTVLTADQSTTNMYNTVHQKSSERIYDATSQVDDAMSVIHQRMNNPVDLIGVSFGAKFKKLDAYTLGIQPKTLTVVAANQSVGKTQICQNFAMYQTTELNMPILWFSLEMDKNRMTFRNLSILSGIDCTAIMTGNITTEQKQILDVCAIKLRQSPFYLSERGHDLSEAIAIARRYVQTKHVKMVYVDYAQLQYVTDKRTETRSRELGMISKAWKEFSQEMDVAVIMISQLGRQALEADTAEAEHGYGSYEIAQDSDNYITLKDKSKEEIEQGGIEHGNKTLNISKNRMGEKSVLIDIYADGPNYIMQEC
jgi:DNA primase catalytic core